MLLEAAHGNTFRNHELKGGGFGAGSMQTATQRFEMPCVEACSLAQASKRYTASYIHILRLTTHVAYPARIQTPRRRHAMATRTSRDPQTILEEVAQLPELHDVVHGALICSRLAMCLVRATWDHPWERCSAFGITLVELQAVVDGVLICPETRGGHV